MYHSVVKFLMAQSIVCSFKSHPKARFWPANGKDLVLRHCRERVGVGQASWEEISGTLPYRAQFHSSWHWVLRDKPTHCPTSKLPFWLLVESPEFCLQRSCSCVGCACEELISFGSHQAQWHERRPSRDCQIVLYSDNRCALYLLDISSDHSNFDWNGSIAR